MLLKIRVDIEDKGGLCYGIRGCHQEEIFKPQQLPHIGRVQPRWREKEEERDDHQFCTQGCTPPPRIGQKCTETPDSNTGPIGDEILERPSLDDTIITDLKHLTVTVVAIDSSELENTPGVATVLGAEEQKYPKYCC